MPQSLSELYTLQSRRIELVREQDKVIGYILIGGDFFTKDNAFIEQMTLWRNASKNEKSGMLFQPKRHDPSKQIWRDFAAIASQSGGRMPGVVMWTARLIRDGILPQGLVRFKTVSAKYADKDFFIDDIFSDSMAFS